MNVAALIGSPVGHSLSPAIHRAAFTALDEEWAFVSFDVPAGRAGEALAAMRALGIRGLAVTTPHKKQVADEVDDIDPASRAMRSVNTVVADGGRLVGYSTDGDGLVDGLLEAGVEISGTSVAVLGAGGAARSIVEALGRNAATNVVVVNRTASHAAAAARLCRVAGVGSIEDVRDADIVVNATSVGMGSDASPLPSGTVHSAQVVVDIVYHPLETALLREARGLGCDIVDGLTMLVHQAVRQQVLWTGMTPDAAALRRAAEAELAQRGATPTPGTLG